MADGAEWHGLLPVLARWLANGRASFVPRDIDAEVRQTAHTEAMRGVALANELTAIVSRLEGAGVPTIALMGPAVAMRASDVVSHRPPGNLDLLVKAGDVERALSVFDALDYRLADTVIPGQDAALAGARVSPWPDEWGRRRRGAALAHHEAAVRARGGGCLLVVEC